MYRKKLRTPTGMVSLLEVFFLLGYYASYVGSYLPTFQGRLSVPSARLNTEKAPTALRWKPEISVSLSTQSLEIKDTT
jgi:hypothetical protein